MEKKNGLAIAALVLAINSVATFWMPIVNVMAIFVAIVGLILGLCALGHPKKTMAIVAASLCAVAIIGAILINNITAKAVVGAVDKALEEVTSETLQSEIEAIEPTSIEVVAEPTESMTTGQKNALEAAKKHISLLNFSHDGLVKQLEFEQYSHEDAVYAADNCCADWNEQAVKAAKNYLSISSFSKDGLIQQLEFDKFTHEQAVYGAEQNGY